MTTTTNELQARKQLEEAQETLRMVIAAYHMGERVSGDLRKMIARVDRLTKLVSRLSSQP